MTHILINIAELEAKAKKLRQANVSEYHAIANSYDQLIKRSKQISLDEKDIELNTAKAVAGRYELKDIYNQFAAGGFVSGYKQAFKDLL